MSGTYKSKLPEIPTSHDITHTDWNIPQTSVKEIENIKMEITTTKINLKMQPGTINNKLITRKNEMMYQK